MQKEDSEEAVEAVVLGVEDQAIGEVAGQEYIQGLLVVHCIEQATEETRKIMEESVEKEILELIALYLVVLN